MTKAIEVPESTIRAALIDAGVKNLKEFGYPDVRADNILTVPIFGGFFRSMLEDNKGKSPSIDKVIDELINEIDNDPNTLTKK